MSLLQNLALSIQDNVRQLESEVGEDQNQFFAHKPVVSKFDDLSYTHSQVAVELIDKLRADIKALEAAITPAKYKLTNLGLSSIKASALDVAIELDITDRIEAMGGSVTIDELATKLQVNANKLGHVLRILAAEGVFVETTPNNFSNTRHSLELTSAGNGKDMISFFARECSQSTLGLYKSLTSPEARNSFGPETAPFTFAFPDSRSFLEWLTRDNNAKSAKKVMMGVVPYLNQITRPALIHDYPWSALGSARVIDLGCGPGDAAVDIMRQYPDLRWTFQDLPSVVENTEKDLKSRLPPDVLSRMRFEAQDYFQPNKSKGDVFFLRGVIRDYGDEETLAILAQAKEAMRDVPGARMLINEIVCGAPALISNTKPMDPSSHNIPSNQSSMIETANLMASSAQSIFGGCERSLYEIQKLLDQTGLEIKAFYQLRSFTAMIECTVKNSA
ncbi:unnamed protein product [Penicillium glandicola]